MLPKMSEKQFNINELLDKKKQLEKQEKEFIEEIGPSDLMYRVEDVTDHTNKKNNRKMIPRQKQTLFEYCQRYNGVVDELRDIKTAIQKYNAKTVVGLIQQRDNARKKLVLLTKLKENVPREKKFGRQVTRQDKDGVALETVDIIEEPMFTREEIGVLFDEVAAQERKCNTAIQKENLNARIKI